MFEEEENKPVDKSEKDYDYMSIEEINHLISDLKNKIIQLEKLLDKKKEKIKNADNFFKS
ncbi:MAG: hypothetical protein CMI90_02605 [Pelagibacteraceae bacterium]|jgi:uncharacterized small protein (DUF1192 family)|nr:hypothetical protein [Pelagibacteraceae bacterium]|tara:strand:+ start:1470 stop:1649 length:180 start_codon:yes stop_codon:yes gene_type:complete